MNTNAAQRTPDWFRQRLGKITGSMAGVLMKEGRGGTFTDTARSYLYQLAAERTMNPEIVMDDMLFGDYLEQTETTSKAMRFGTEQEPEAREWYMLTTGRRVVETGSVSHPSIPHFASSPDGFFYDEAAGEKGCIEIKCPNQSTFMRYRTEVHDGESLLKVKPEYFYQCMSHMMVTGAAWCDFVAWCPFQSEPLHIVRVLPDGKVFDEMERRILLADEFIGNVVSGAQNGHGHGNMQDGRADNHQVS